jgi:uncharacterized protein YjbJ (UPF0337 family)
MFAGARGVPEEVSNIYKHRYRQGAADFCRRSILIMAFIKQGKESVMNWDRIEGNWKQMKGNVKQKWGKLTDYQLDVIAGKRDQLAGKIQEAYGISKDEVEKQISKWQKLLK